MENNNTKDAIILPDKLYGVCIDKEVEGKTEQNIVWCNNKDEAVQLIADCRDTLLSDEDTTYSSEVTENELTYAGIIADDDEEFHITDGCGTSHRYRLFAVKPVW